MASGAFVDLAEQYIAGTQTYPLSVDASDSGSGILGMAVLLNGHTVLRAVLSCTHPQLGSPAPCPATAHADFQIDTSKLHDGVNTLAPAALDAGGSIAFGAPWTVIVDRQAPPVPSAALWSYDPGKGIADIGFSGQQDPSLADGTAGAGVSGFVYRYAIDAGPFGDWTSTDDTGFEVPNLAAGQTLHVETRTVDGAGNTSAAGAAAIVVSPVTPPADPDASLPDGVSPEPQPEPGANVASTYSFHGAPQQLRLRRARRLHAIRRADLLGTHDCEGELDPSPVFRDPDLVTFHSTLRCGGAVSARAQVCVQVKKAHRFWFDSWKSLNCEVIEIPFNNVVLHEATAQAPCVPGRHVYRGWVRTTYFDPQFFGLDNPFETSVSVEQLKVNCIVEGQLQCTQAPDPGSPPANDSLLCAARVPDNAADQGLTIGGTLENATLENGENSVRPAFGMPPLINSVWYVWTPAQDTTPTSIFATAVDPAQDNPYVTVWTGAPGVTTLQPYLGPGNEFAGGTTYYIQVGAGVDQVNPASSFALVWGCACF